MSKASMKLTPSTFATWLLAVTLVVGLALSAWVLQTPAPRSGGGTLEAFPGVRAMQTLARLMGPGQPHPIGSRANAEVRSRIVASLEQAGLSPQIQTRFVCSAFRRYCGTVSNVLARIEGQRPGALLLNSHYDTQPASPGAADPMSGVAVLVELAQLLGSARPPERSVIFLFNDGEEAGLLGATAFVEHHPWAADVAAVVNLDARGSAGSSIPAYTIGHDSVVLAPFAAAGGRVPGGSALRAISALLPNSNDLAVFDRLVVPGVLFGYAQNIRHYHTPRDDLAHLNPGSLQQQGDQALAVVRGFAYQATPLQEGRMTYASMGPLVLYWPERYSGWIALGVAVCLLAVLIGMRRRQLFTRRELLWGLGAFPLLLLVSFFGAAIANALRKAATPLPLTWVSEPGPTVLGFAAVAAMFLFMTALLLRRHAGVIGLWGAIAGWWSVMAVVVSALAPGFGYLFSLPAGAAAIAAAIWLLSMSADRPRWQWIALAGALSLPAAATVALWMPHLGLILDLIGLGNMPPLAMLLALALTPALPMLLASSRPWLWPAGLLILATVSLGIGTRKPAFSTTHPQWGSLLYSADLDRQTANWIYTGSPVPETLAALGFSDKTTQALPWISNESGAVMPASAPSLAGPELELLDSKLDERGQRHVRARLVSPRGAPVMQVVFEQAMTPIEWRIVGVKVPADGVTRALFVEGNDVVTIWTMPPEGVELEWVFHDGSPRSAQLADRSYDLPAAGAPLVSARPEDAAPVATGDGTLVTRRVTF